MKVEVDVLGFPSLTSQYGLCGREATLKKLRAQELCEKKERIKQYAERERENVRKSVCVCV